MDGETFDFSVQFQRLAVGHYRLSGDCRLSGDFNGELLLPPAGAALWGQLEQFRAAAQYHTTTTMTRPQIFELGHALYALLFQRRVATAFEVATSKLGEHDTLRIKLELDPDQTDLAALPWEFAVGDDNLPLVISHSFVRYLRQARAPGPLMVREPLRLLLLAAEPVDRPSLNVELEVEEVRAAVQPLVERGRLELSVVEHATVGRFQQELRRYRPHMLHFVGHGAIVGGDGGLVFEDDERRSVFVDSVQLSAQLSRSSVRLALLNACQTGAFDGELLGSVAYALVQAQIPAVVTMQALIDNAAARAFSASFYETIAEGLPVDTALVQGRRAMTAAFGFARLDWGMPILAMRAPDGVLFDVSQQAPATSASSSAATLGATHTTIINAQGSQGFVNQPSGPVSQQYQAQPPVQPELPNGDLEHLRERRRKMRDEYNAYDLQRASFGLYTPPFVTIRLKELEREIATLDRQIADLERGAQSPLESRPPTRATPEPSPPPRQVQEPPDTRPQPTPVDSSAGSGPAARGTAQALRRRMLEERIATLTEEYEAVNRQIRHELNDVTKLRLQRQAEDLIGQIDRCEQELQALDQAP